MTELQRARPRRRTAARRVARLRPPRPRRYIHSAVMHCAALRAARDGRAAAAMERRCGSHPKVGWRWVVDRRTITRYIFTYHTYIHRYETRTLCGVLMGDGSAAAWSAGVHPWRARTGNFRAFKNSTRSKIRNSARSDIRTGRISACHIGRLGVVRCSAHSKFKIQTLHAG